MSDTTTIDQLLAEATITGLDISDALSRMNNSPKLYMRIVHSFVTLMPDNLEELATATITAATLADYAIKIHGAKGSCYGIGANAVGDEARALELAAKGGDLQACLSNNDAFIARTEELIKELEALEARVEALENSAGDKAQAVKPDTLTLQRLLTATQQYDIDEMTRLAEELVSMQYAQDAELVMSIKKSIDAFDYQAVEKTIAAYL